MNTDWAAKIQDAVSEIVPVFLKYGQRGSSIKLRISSYTVDISLSFTSVLFVTVLNGRCEIEDGLTAVARKAAGLTEA